MRHKCLGIFLVFLFFITFSLTFLLFNFKTTFFDSNFYIKALRNAKFYSNTTKNIPDILKDFNKGKAASDQISPESIQIISKSVKSKWLQEQTEKNLISFFNWFDGKTNKLNISVDLTPFKGAFEKSFFAEMQKSYNALPVCKNSSELKNSSSADMPSCRPSGESFAQIKSEMLSKINSGSMTGDIPDTYNFSQNNNNFKAGIFSNPGNTFKILNIFSWVFLILSIIILGLIILIAKNSLKSIFKWVGISIAIPSFIILIFSSISRAIFGLNLITNSFSNLQSKGSEIAAKIFIPLIQLLIKDFSNRKIIESAIFFGVAIILIIISAFLKEKQEISKI